MGSGGPDDNDGQAGRLVVPVSGDALRVGDALTPSPDAEGRVRLRNPGLGVGEEGDPAFTVTGAAPGAIGIYVKAQKAHDPEDSERWEDADVAPALDEGGHGPRTATAVVSHALTGEGHDASEDGTGRGTPLAYALRRDPGGTGQGHNTNYVGGSSVRRLTPVECCRLQSFPDDWLGEPNEQPDSPRYAAMGDAVTVNVAEWIGQRLMEVMSNE